MATAMLLLLAGLFLFALFCITLNQRTSSSLAPGPPSLPLVGHLHLLVKGPDAPHILLMKLARCYGPIMSLRFGSVPVVVASTKEAAKEFYKTHDLVFASRPSTSVGRLLLYGYQDLAFAPYNERWRNLRRLCTLELFTQRRIESYKSLRKQELGSLLRCLYTCRGEVVDMRHRLMSTMFNFICRVLIGKRYYDQAVSKDDAEATKFMHLIEELIRLSGVFSIGEYLPWLRWLDLNNFETEFKNVSKEMDALLEKILVEHEMNPWDSIATEDFVHLMLKLRDQGEDCLQHRDGIKALLINLFSAGSDTSTLTMEWGLAELIKHPKCMAKLQDDIAKVVGMERLVEESDVPKLEYLDAVVKEIVRLHPPAPLSVPHSSIQDCKVMGYDTTKGTTLLMNLYAIGRDPDVWDDPMSFKPERFIGTEVDFKGRHYELVPFGSGRRICPGIGMSMSMVYVSLANLVHAFRWEVPAGYAVDTVNEEYGLTVCMVNKLQAIPQPRLKSQIYGF